jgi:UPF0716 protein FxsA
LLFTLVPAIELYLIIIFTGVLGAYYARQQGIRVVSNIQWKMQQGAVPGDDLVNGAMLLVGGALLITPGFITDFAGFSLIFPPSREAIKVGVKRYLEKKVRQGEVKVYRY